MEKKQSEDEIFIIESEDGGEKKEAQLVSKINKKIGVYVTEDGEQLVVSTDDKLSNAQVMHKLYRSEAFGQIMEHTGEDIEYEADSEDTDVTNESYEGQEGVEDASGDILQSMLMSIAGEDSLLDCIDRVATFIKNMTDEQTEKLGPEGVEELFTVLSKFYYTYIQSTNPLWEVAQVRYSELRKWQKLYMDKYYHKL